MAIKLTSTKTAPKFVKSLVYGGAGVGKTVLASTAPNPLIISAESGLMSLADLDIPVIEVTTKDEVDEAYKYALESDYDTICLDSISEIAEVVLAGEKKNFKDGRKAYGVMNDQMVPLIRNFRDIKDKHIYFTSKQVRLVDEGNGITAISAIPVRLVPVQLASDSAVTSYIPACEAVKMYGLPVVLLMPCLP